MYYYSFFNSWILQSPQQKTIIILQQNWSIRKWISLSKRKIKNSNLLEHPRLTNTAIRLTIGLSAINASSASLAWKSLRLIWFLIQKCLQQRKHWLHLHFIYDWTVSLNMHRSLITTNIKFMQLECLWRWPNNSKHLL